MSKSVVYVGLDVHKDSIAIAVAREGRKPAEKWQTIPYDGGSTSESRENARCRGASPEGLLGFGPELLPVFYYGGADTCLALATAQLSDLLGYPRTCPVEKKG